MGDMRLAITHGGIHSLYESVAAGLPVACVPHKGDQWINCRDIQRQSLGWAIHPKAVAAEASAVLKMLLDGEFANRIPQAQTSLEAAGGPAAVVRHVTSLDLK